MQLFTLNSNHLSNVVWGTLADYYAPELSSTREIISEMYAHTEAIRDQMERPTGTVFLNSAIALYCLTRWVKPRVVFEIGTFVGNSALSIGKAMEVNGVGGEIHTCDGTNTFKVPTELTQTSITGYPTTKSTDALEAVASAGKKVDLFHLDGRLMKRDCELIAALSHESTVFALDDFEGVEKGVMNMMALMSRKPWNQTHIQVAPPSAEVLRRFSEEGNACETALLIPEALFRFHRTNFAAPVF